jgi:hypothetical protein
MSNNEFTDAELREYLLGQATPETTESLDELSFTDDFAERIGTVEHDLIDEYLAGELPASETRAFDSHYLASPLRLEKVQFAKALSAFAARSGSAEAVSTGAKISFWDGLRNWRLAFQFGMAAAGLLLVAIFGLMIYRSCLTSGGAGPAVATDLGSPTPAVEVIAPSTPKSATAVTPANTQTASIPDRPSPNQASTQPRPQPTPTQPKRQQPSLAVFTLTPALRSTSYQSVKLPSGPARFDLRLESELDGRFTAEIIELKGQTKIWSARSLVARGRDDDRTVSLRLAPGTIGTGEHRVTVFARGTGGQQEKVGDYFFRVAP